MLCWVVSQMPKRTQTKGKEAQQSPGQDIDYIKSLCWVKATYNLHTFAYRDPRSAFSSAPGLPVVSPTAVLLGIVSTLFNLGRAEDALAFLKVMHTCKVVVEPPEGVIFFRAFHQLRRYETGQMKTSKEKFKPNPRVGFTKINQGTREYGLVEGPITLFVAVPESSVEPIKLALRNRDHLGTHDSLCSLVGEVETSAEPQDVVYLSPEEWQNHMPDSSGITIVTLSRFKGSPVKPTVGKHWWMAGGEDTELASYLIKGRFFGTSRGKIYRK